MSAAFFFAELVRLALCVFSSISVLTSVMKLVEPVEFSYIAHSLSFSSGVHSGAGPPSASEPNLL